VSVWERALMVLAMLADLALYGALVWALMMLAAQL